MSCRNSRAVSDGLLVLGEIALDAAFLFAAERRIGQDHVHPVGILDLGQLLLQTVSLGDLRRFQAVQQQVHLAEHVGERFGFAAEDALLLKDPPLLDRLALLFQVGVGLDQKAARAAGRVENLLPKLRIGHGDHEANDGPAACRTRRNRRRRPASP